MGSREISKKSTRICYWRLELGRWQTYEKEEIYINTLVVDLARSCGNFPEGVFRDDLEVLIIVTGTISVLLELKSRFACVKMMNSGSICWVWDADGSVGADQQGVSSLTPVSSFGTPCDSSYWLVFLEVLIGFLLSIDVLCKAQINFFQINPRYLFFGHVLLFYKNYRICKNIRAFKLFVSG